MKNWIFRISRSTVFESAESVRDYWKYASKAIRKVRIGVNINIISANLNSNIIFSKLKEQDRNIDNMNLHFFKRWQPRARYKTSLDPTADEVKKLCSSLRRNAKEERVLFHYNGHGVPQPTNNGEIWVFNRVI